MMCIGNVVILDGFVAVSFFDVLGQHKLLPLSRVSVCVDPVRMYSFFARDPSMILVQLERNQLFFLK